jgi:nitrite reductase/ring-hydroxylating ferredoxin subunit
VASKEKFYCPCHAASFDHNGDRQSSVVTRALDTFPVLFEEGLVKVDTSKVANRDHHLPEHFSYAG